MHLQSFFERRLSILRINIACEFRIVWGGFNRTKAEAFLPFGLQRILSEGHLKDVLYRLVKGSSGP